MPLLLLHCLRAITFVAYVVTEVFSDFIVVIAFIRLSKRINAFLFGIG